MPIIENTITNRMVEEVYTWLFQRRTVRRARLLFPFLAFLHVPAAFAQVAPQSITVATESHYIGGLVLGGASANRFTVSLTAKAGARAGEVYRQAYSGGWDEDGSFTCSLKGLTKAAQLSHAGAVTSPNRFAISLSTAPTAGEVLTWDVECHQ